MKTITGEWNEAPNGTLQLKLNQYALIEHYRNAPSSYLIHLDEFGNIPLNEKIWGNDEMMPEGGKYVMTVFDVLRNVVLGPHAFALCGPSPLNLNRLIPSPALAAGFVTLALSSDNMFGQPQPGQFVLIYTSAFEVVFPSGFSNPQSFASCGTAPASPAVYSVQLKGVNVGTVSFSTDGLATFASPGFVLHPGDRLTITAPIPMDSRLSDVGITLVGTRIT